jgi:methylglutaconyl-CoA hydratase
MAALPGSLQVTQRASGVVQVTMAREAVFNAFDDTMIGALDAAFAQLEADDTVRVIVLAGAGKHFSAGADLQWMQRASAASLEWNVADARAFAAMLARIESCSKPTVARGCKAQPSAEVSAWPAPATSPWPPTM